MKFSKSRKIALVSSGVVIVASTCGAIDAYAKTKPSVKQLMQEPSVGIVSPMGMEQAPILAKMKVQGQTTIDGYKFYIGTLNGKNVVDVQTGEMEYAVEMATTIMDQNFHLTANLLTGTAGAQNGKVNVGDVVLSGFVTDQSVLHAYDDGTESGYNGVEMVVTHPSSTQNDVEVKSDSVGPTPADAAKYNHSNFKSTPSRKYTFYSALAGSAGLIRAGENTKLPSIPKSYVTGNTDATGSQPVHIIVGAIAGANQWIDPLIDLEDQNALYQTDAQEDEGMGFGYTNTKFGIPWLVVRGITDSAWYPNNYHGVLGADNAAHVTENIVTHLPSSSALHHNASFAMLSPDSNAKQNGYLVASSVSIAKDGTVTQVTYQNQAGKTVTVNNPNESEYTYPTSTSSTN